jgi:endonuclease-3
MKGYDDSVDLRVYGKGVFMATRKPRKSAPTQPQKPSPVPDEGKEPFDITRAIRLVRAAVRPYPRAGLFELADEGYRSVFHLLVACLISIRTRDEVMIPVARRLFEVASTPAAMAALSVQEIATLIQPCQYPEVKAPRIHEIARQTVSKYGGTLPCDPEVLLSFHGVGPKCTNLVIGIACNKPFISVDSHVHEITNRWGYVHTKTPEKTMLALMEILPRRYWIEINKLLVPFGKHVCLPVSPKCSTCPVLSMCRQVGVTTHR